MKISIIGFFALIALVSSSTVKINSLERNVLPFGLSDSIESFIESALDEYNRIVDEANQFSDEINKLVEDMEKSAENKFQGEISKANVALEILQRIRSNTKPECTRNYQTELLATKTAAMRGIKDCAGPVLEALKNLLKEVTQKGAQLFANIVQLTNLVMECYNKDGTIAVAKCAFQNITAVKELIGDIITGAKDLVSTILSQKDQITEAIKMCSNKEVGIALAKIEEINLNLLKCHGK